MDRVTEPVFERWKPRLRNFLIYILPVIVCEIIKGLAEGDMVLASRMLPAVAVWGLTGRIQAVPIAWAVLLIGGPPLAEQYEGTGKAIWILSAIGVVAGLARIFQRRYRSEINKKLTPWCPSCQKEVWPVRPEFPIGWFALAIALAVIPGSLWGWALTLPMIIFAIRRLSTEPLCPDCRESIPGARIPFDREGTLMWALIVICIGGTIGSHIVYEINQPSEECSAVLERVQELGGPDLWTASESELDRWIEEDPDAWDLMDEVDAACWQDE